MFLGVGMGQNQPQLRTAGLSRPQGIHGGQGLLTTGRLPRLPVGCRVPQAHDPAFSPLHVAKDGQSVGFITDLFIDYLRKMCVMCSPESLAERAGWEGRKPTDSRGFSP